MRPLYRERSRFESALVSELKHPLKGTGWRLRGSFLFREFDGMFCDIVLAVYRNETLTVAQLRTKPIALDTILWDILGMPENRQQPLSFRSNGAFTCSALPVCDAVVERHGTEPSEAANAVLAFCGEAAARIAESLDGKAFSAAVADHPDQVERGAYATTLVTSLILEGHLADARRQAEAYASGSKASCATISIGGRSFHQLALQWLDAGNAGAAPSAARPK